MQSNSSKPKTGLKKRDYGIFQVALKILLKKGRNVLFLKLKDGILDLPGGRIDNVEYATPLHDVLSREICEELGHDIKYAIGSRLFQYRRYNEKRRRYIFITVYEGEWRGGKISLSHEHVDYVWINPETYQFHKEDFDNPEEQRAFRTYFSVSEK